ncbi:MAG: hypothetical protein EBZ77_06630 [Chitinophagia bacterium]|nr:hypothetical protein [Chitinophagia bacterium]
MNAFKSLRKVKETIDYYILPDGRLVFTAHFLLTRGYCCGSGCLNCPYEYEKVPEPRRTLLLTNRKNSGKDGQ